MASSASRGCCRSKRFSLASPGEPLLVESLRARCKSTALRAVEPQTASLVDLSWTGARIETAELLPHPGAIAAIEVRAFGLGPPLGPRTHPDPDDWLELANEHRPGRIRSDRRAFGSSVQARWPGLIVLGPDDAYRIWDVHLETRTPSEIADLVAVHAPWRLTEGRLAPLDEP